MNRSKLWGFEVGQILASIVVLAVSNVIFGILRAPLILSWVLALGTLGMIRIVSLGQKNGHLELVVRFMAEPHLFLGHQERGRNK